MSWGVATQNGVSVSLTSIVSLSAGVTEFSPADLFTGGVQGAWYDPSDYSTLFQDSSGTTPVTAVEQPVGLMLDKSQGLVLGSELVTNGDFSSGTTGWTLGTGWSISGGAAVATAVASGASLESTGQCVSGQWYRATVTVTAYTAGGFSFAVGGNAAGQVYNAAGTYTQYFLAPATGFIQLIRRGSDFTGSVDNISVKALPGNHASQATAASRPVLRARYNLLTYSEQFDNAAWFAGSTTVSANQATAPDGTVTADLVYVATTGASRYIWRNASVFTASAQVITSSFYLKASSWTWVMVNGTGTNTGVWFNIATGQKGTESAGYTGTITDAGNGWWRCTVTETRTGTVQPTVFLCDANNSLTATASGTNGVYLWGAQLSYGSSAGTYQRIAAATDYATAGFLPYLSADGVDDQMSSGNINLTGTDKLTAVFGSFTNSTANQGVFQFGASGAGTMNALYMAGATTDMRSSLQGSTGTSQMRITGTGLGVAAVYSELYNIAGATAADESQIRLNGTLPTQTVQSAGPAGGGNFANTALSILQFGSVFFLNGRLYGLVFCGKTLSASELSATESWMAAKTGVTL